MKAFLTILPILLTLKLYSQDSIRFVLTDSYHYDTVEVKIDEKTELFKVFVTNHAGFAGDFYIKKTNNDKNLNVKIKVNQVEKNFFLKNNKNYYLTYNKKRRLINLIPTNRIIIK